MWVCLCGGGVLNDTQYGSFGSVWCHDVGRRRVASQPAVTSVGVFVSRRRLVLLPVGGRRDGTVGPFRQGLVFDESV